MGRKLPSLNALKTFESAARNLSFSGAAAELNVTQAAVSRQIKLLEEDLGVQLFRRLTRAVQLTEEGISLYPPLRDALDQIELAAARVWNSGDSGLLTISVLPTFSVKWLMPRLLGFAEQYPGVEIHLVNSIKPVDFDREDIDLAIRAGSLDQNRPDQRRPRIDLNMVKSWEGVSAEFLMPDELVAVMAPGYRDPAADPIDERTLSEVTLLQMATRPNAWPDFFEAMGWRVPGGRSGPSFGHFFLALQAAIEGRGIALLPQVLALDDLRAGRIVQALPVRVRSAGDYYLLGRSSLWDRKNVKLFRDWLLTEIRQSEPWATEK
ncbi:Gcv operon activator [Hartmannibacter diazotrophicus]|uniref:Gcv operon activator n=1 Tax=Hartmannibacter diazotrophicus TaxID=1482074 RepID=A0A2C9D5V5_9HYPH|nr:Gcv operon activator [Hartmannibacter diazotrophicus]